MKKVLLMLAVAASMSVASAQETKPSKKDCCKNEVAKKKDCCKKEEASCCSPSSKAKAVITAKPAVEKKG